jgi:hypothetical protein
MNTLNNTPSSFKPLDVKMMFNQTMLTAYLITIKISRFRDTHPLWIGVVIGSILDVGQYLDT